MERDKPSTTASCVSDDAADGTDAPYDARMRTPQLIGMIALASIWGASFMFIKVMLDGIGPIAIAWVRLGGGAALVLAVAAARGGVPPARRPGLARHRAAGAAGERDPAGAHPVG